MGNGRKECEYLFMILLVPVCRIVHHEVSDSDILNNTARMKRRTNTNSSERRAHFCLALFFDL